jgi:predicted ATPase
MPNHFERLTVHHWRQFERVDIVFHPVLTVLTGANGAGKTTLLNLLGRHFGWNIALIATAKPTRKGLFRYFSGAGDELDEEEAGPERPIGEVTYTDGQRAAITVPIAVAESFSVSLHNQQQVDGVFLPSHRAVYTYQQLTSIPTQVDARAQLFEQYYSNLRSMYEPNARYQSPSYRLKAALISLATFGFGNAVVQPNIEARSTFEGFQTILVDVLPRKLGFKRLSIRMPEIVLECASGDFSLDAASGGVAALIDIAWQLYMKSLITPGFIAVCDEPENHLHPEMQRTVLPGLIAAFPGVQFIVATHNPFIVNSVEESNVVVLDYEDRGAQQEYRRVVSNSLETVDRAGSANRVLTDVLGVPVPLPIWVEERIDRIVERFEGRDLSDETLRDLREEMSQVGLADLFPSAVSDLLRRPAE